MTLDRNIKWLQVKQAHFKQNNLYPPPPMLYIYKRILHKSVHVCIISLTIHTFCSIKFQQNLTITITEIWLIETL